MGFDYYCPKCGGPAYGPDKETPCDACRSGYPSFVDCSCGTGISTVRCGYSKCKYCDKYTCDHCNICKQCFDLKKDKKYSKLKKQNEKLKQKLAEFGINYSDLPGQSSGDCSQSSGDCSQSRNH